MDGFTDAGIETMKHEKQMIANFVENFHSSDNNGNDDDDDNGHTSNEIYKRYEMATLKQMGKTKRAGNPYTIDTQCKYECVCMHVLIIHV